MSENVGRARGRGRARGQAPGGGGPPRGPGQPMQQGPPQPQQPGPPRGAWGPPQQAPQAQAPQQQPAQRAPQPQSVGRARTTDVTKSMGEMKIGDGAQGEKGAPSRGNMRGGGRHLPEVTFVRTRPETANTKKGTTGTPIKLMANYFKIATQLNWCLYQYRVDFSPDEDRTFARKKLMQLHRNTIGGYIFDGTVLYTPHRLNPDPMDLYSKREEDGQTIKITLKIVGDLSPGDHHYIQVFNILMRRCYGALKLELVGRDYFDPGAKVEIFEHKLQIWPGYKTTIAQYEQDILMVAEIAHKVIRMDTVLDVLKKHSHKSTFRNDFQAEILGSIVLTDYNNKTYRVDDVLWNANPLGTFSSRGNDISYVTYYRDKYNIQIRDMNQPLLVTRSKPRDIRAGAPETLNLIPELCRMTGLTNEMRSNMQLMRALAQHTRVGPDTRINKLMQFNHRIQNTRECVDDLKQWDMVVEKRLVEFTARQLPQEAILQGPGGEIRYQSGDTNDGWTRELRSKKMLSLGNVSRWVMVVPQRMRREADSFASMIMKAGAGMGMNFSPPVVCEIPTDQIGVYVEKLEYVASQMKPNIILCVVSNDRGDRYAAIKKKCFVDRAVPTQVVTGRCINNKSAMSIATKVAIQMNCKVGGAAWSVGVPLNNIMVVGFDVCHDAQMKSKSYGAIVASLDKAMSRYYSAVTPHAEGQELSDQFGFNMKKALHKYKEFNNVLPTHILIYRDGVGEGQIPYVYEHEVKIIKDALAEIYNGHNYKMGFIIVTKRLNTRFFVANNMSNPKPGTVIDDVVTSPERYDFFLVSQAVREGTVSPTSYNVIHDTLGLSPDQIQRLTYKFCHMYFNFSGQVRVPAPCQYAHKLAFMIGQHLHLTPNSALETLLYFL